MKSFIKRLKKLSRMGLYLMLTCVVAIALTLISHPALAQTVSFDLGKDVYGQGSTASRMIQLLGLLTVLSVAPSIMLMCTCFTRFIIIFGLLRTAMGVQQSPPTQVLASLALFLTIFAMMPVLQSSWTTGISPMIEGDLTEMEGIKATSEPFRKFMIANTRDKDLSLFSGMAKVDPKIKKLDLPFYVVIPSYMISEIKRGFEAGFLMFIPFLVIDMVVASVLMAMGMMMLPPVVISLPFKIIYFVLIDGWYMMSGSLVKTVVIPSSLTVVKSVTGN